jgi:hypothetical protein
MQVSEASAIPNRLVSTSALSEPPDPRRTLIRAPDVQELGFAALGQCFDEPASHRGAEIFACAPGVLLQRHADMVSEQVDGTATRSNGMASTPRSLGWRSMVSSPRGRR